MDQGGERLSRSLGERDAPRHSARASARLGLTLRSVLLSPRDGYAAAKRTGERRARAGERMPEGASPYVLAAAGGAALMCLWLKLGALVGLRDARLEQYDGPLVVAALLLGATISLTGQALWGALGPPIAQRLGGRARPRDLRLVWGASFFPLVGVLALLPLDLLIVGRGVFSVDPVGDAISTAWASLSIAVGLALLAWSAWLFLRGVQVASDLRLHRALPASVAGALCFAVLMGFLVVVDRLAGGTA